MWKKRTYNTKEHPYCRNCHYPLAANAKYCFKCGQKNSDGRITFGIMAMEFIQNTFDLDSKIFKTLLHLPIPGKLTNEYFKGRHKRYMHPVRLLFIILILLLASASVYINYNKISRETNVLGRQERYVKSKVLLSMDSTVQALKVQQPSVRAQEALDSIHRYIQIKTEELNIEDSLKFNMVVLPGEKSQKIAWDDFHDLDEEALVKKYTQGMTFWEKVLFERKLKILNNPGSLIRFMVGNTTWMVLLMIPLFSIVLKLFYVLKPFYYVEHFVFTTHMHAFGLGLTLIWVLLINWFPEEFIGFIFIVWMLYILIAMKRYYKQSWAMTIFKFAILSVAYMTVLSVATVLTVLLAVFLF